MLKISTAPHFYSPVDTRLIMRDVIIALAPAGLAAVALFGLAALVTMVTAVAGCVLFEYVCSKWWLKTTPSTRDLSAVVTGLLLAYNLPCNMPVWMTLIGCFVAIVITKMAFGGIGKNLFNPALVGRVFLFISFPVQMTTWVRPHLFDFMNADVTTSATTLGILKHVDAATSATQLTGSLSELPGYLEMFLGYTGGSMGEVSALALLIGFLLSFIPESHFLAYPALLSRHIFHPHRHLLADYRFTGNRTGNAPAVGRTSARRLFHGDGLHNLTDE